MRIRGRVAAVVATAMVFSYGAASAVGVGAGGVGASSNRATVPVSAPAGCSPRLLVLSAFPTELGPLLARAKPQGGNPVAVGSHTFYLGDLEGHRVAMTITGIGPANARNTTRLALSHFRCEGRSTITGIVFAGVAGGDYIGDVNAATRWTMDGKHYVPVSKAMARVARVVASEHKAHLIRSAYLPDLLCIPINPDVGPTITLTHAPTFKVGGTGLTTDPFDGKAFPCVPGATDVFGCRPCQAQNVTPKSPVTLLQSLLPFISPSFFTGYFASQASPPGKYVSEDNETGEIAKLARSAHLPFIGFRGVSDGGGDPLHLPGYPFSFFVYQQISADNVGSVAAAFIRAWRDASTVTPQH